MLVTFHGVRGSTPCHGDEIARYGGNTACVSVDAPGEDPLLFDLGTGLRYFGLRCPKSEPFRGTCLLSHLHWDHVQGLPFFGPLLHEETELVVYAPSQECGRTAAEVLDATICPPLFPVGLDGFPGSIKIRQPPRRFKIGGFDVESADVPHVGEALGYRVTHGGASVAYISDHQQPSGAADRRQRVRAVPGRRPADPRRPVHAGRVRPKEHVGALHDRVRGVARRRGRCQAAGAVPPRPDPRRRHDGPPGDRGRLLRRGRWASTCSPPARAWWSSSEHADRPCRRSLASPPSSSGRCSSSPARPSSPVARRGSPRPGSWARRSRSATVVPGVELVLGAALVTGVAMPIPALTAIVVLVAFSVVIARQLVDGRHPPCACFGAWSTRPLGEGHLMRNAGLVVVAVIAASPDPGCLYSVVSRNVRVRASSRQAS